MVLLTYNVRATRRFRETIQLGNKKLQRIDQDLSDLSNLLQDLFEFKGEDFLTCMEIGSEINRATQAIERACVIAQSPKRKGTPMPKPPRIILSIKGKK